jgi:hypothetical protein
MKPLSRHDMSFDQAQQWIEGHAHRSHGVRHGRERDRHPLKSVTISLPVQALMLANFWNMIIASRLGPAHPLATTWNGAGGGLIFSQSRQLNFSRTVSITFHCRGEHSAGGSITTRSRANARGRSGARPACA